MQVDGGPSGEKGDIKGEWKKTTVHTDYRILGSLLWSLLWVLPLFSYRNTKSKNL